MAKRGLRPEEGVGSEWSRKGLGLLPQVLGVLVLGEKAGSYRYVESSLRMGKELCEDPGKM